jgi:hypothetical protein
MMKIGIIGAGAAGLVAAITAARLGQEVMLFERQNRVGKKILVTGNGRCNLTNENMSDLYFHTSSNIKKFNPIHLITIEETLAFFEELGIARQVEQGKIYPQSEQAASVVDVLREEVEHLNIQVYTDTTIIDLKKQNNGWQLMTKEGKGHVFSRIIIATGGLAAPQLGCDSLGYELAKKLGHSIVEPLPTLVHILSSSRYCKMMQGTRIKANVSLFQEGDCKRVEYGEVLFTEDGLSGPPIFQVSRMAARSKHQNIPCEIRLDLFKDQTIEELIDVLYQRIGRASHKSIEGMLVGYIHKKLIVPLIKASDIGSPIAPCIDLEYDMIWRLAKTMKQFSFDVTGTRGFKFAQATAGGVSLDEIDLQTLESKVQKGVYLVGEILDVDGDCGGYNLQWAWSTGILAAKNAAKKDTQ